MDIREHPDNKDIFFEFNNIELMIHLSWHVPV